MKAVVFLTLIATALAVQLPAAAPAPAATDPAKPAPTPAPTPATTTTATTSANTAPANPNAAASPLASANDQLIGTQQQRAALITNEPLRAGQQFVVKADDEGSFHGGGFLLVPVTIPVAPVAPVAPVVPVAPVTPAALVAVPVGLGGGLGFGLH